MSIMKIMKFSLSPRSDLSFGEDLKSFVSFLRFRLIFYQKKTISENLEKNKFKLLNFVAS